MRSLRLPSPRLLAPLAVALLAGACTAGNGEARPAGPAAATTPADGMQVREVAGGLDHPWAVEALPDGRLLVTERPGALRIVTRDGVVSEPLAGVPAVWANGQGGLLDVALSPTFAADRTIYLSYAEAGDGDTAGTAIARATLGDDGLSDVDVVFRQVPKLVGPNHFGSRLVFDRGGHLFATFGERNDRPTAQDLGKLQGKVVRLMPDGSIPAGNPFAGRGDAHPAVWSYGHRNPQAAALDPRTGRLWTAEHGPRGGDEINLPVPGANYGWPLATHGINYSGLPIPEAVGETAPGTVPPHHVWGKSPGLSGMAFLTGHPESAWNDSLFLGALADGNLIRLSLDGDRIAGEERLLGDMGRRVRDVTVDTEGQLFVVTDHDDGELLHIVPPAR
ncbi:hydrophobic compound transporter HcuB [Luteimonas pelagia]